MDVFTLPPWVGQIIQQVGPFAVILLVLFWYVPRHAIASFIEAQQNQAIAMAGIKDALVTMVEKEGRLDEKLDVTILNQRLMITHLENMEERAEANRAATTTQIQTLQELILSGRKPPQSDDPPPNT